MLVLSRHEGERIVINEDIVIEVVRIAGDKVRIGITAPAEIPIHRGEIHAKIMRERAGDRPA